jgi:hypothetical protein
MITMICEKTGIPFEAENRRRKSHPVVQSWMQKAYEEGWYQQANDAIYGNSARFVEKQTFETIEQFVAYFTQLQKDSVQANNAREITESQRKRDEAESRRRRHITTSLLRGRGYTWQRGYSDSDIENDIWNGEGEPTGAWELVSPDHRTVSVKEAMFELAFYEDAKFAHEWLASRGIAEELPDIEAKRQEEAAVEYTDEQIAYQQEAIPAFIEAGHSPELAEEQAIRLSLPHSPWEDFVLLSEPELLSDGRHAILVINGDLRYGALVSDEWYGLDELIEEYPDFPLRKRLELYRERNKRNASK